MAFVEKANTTVQDLKESVFQGSDYTVQTTGTRNNQPRVHAYDPFGTL